MSPSTPSRALERVFARARVRSIDATRDARRSPVADVADVIDARDRWHARAYRGPTSGITRARDIGAKIGPMARDRRFRDDGVSTSARSWGTQEGHLSARARRAVRKRVEICTNTVLGTR